MDNLKEQDTAVKTEYGKPERFHMGKYVVQGCILSPHWFNLYAEYIICKAGLDASEGGVQMLEESSVI